MVSLVHSDTGVLWGPVTLKNDEPPLTITTALTNVADDEEIHLIVDGGPTSWEFDGVWVDLVVSAFPNLNHLTHDYRGEYGITQGNLDDNNTTNDWRYRQASVNTSTSYRPLSGTVTDLELQRHHRRPSLGNRRMALLSHD